MAAPAKSKKPSVGIDKTSTPTISADHAPTIVPGRNTTGATFTGETFVAKAGDRLITDGISHQGGESSSSHTGAGGQITLSEADNPTDDKFIAEFKRICGLSPLATSLKLASLCARKTSFSAEKETLRRLKLSASKFCKLAQIGRDRRLDGILNRLPQKAGHSVLYAMSQLSDEQWQRGFDSGLIDPQSSRSTIDAFRTGTSKKPARHRSEPFFAAVTIPHAVSDKDKVRFRADFISLCESAGFEPTFPGDQVS